MKHFAIILVLTASAFGQSVVLAPPAEQVHPTEHTGTFAITYYGPRHASTATPTLVLESPQGDVSCYASTDAQGTIHSHCEDLRLDDMIEHSRTTLYLRNFHGTNGEFFTLPAQGTTCDPLQALVSDAVARHLYSVTFAYKESRNAITVACSYTDAKGKMKQGQGKYDVYAVPKP